VKGVEQHVYREVITSSPKKVSITLPSTLVGKTVEVFAFEAQPERDNKRQKVNLFSKEDFWETFGSGKNSLMMVDTIREKSWRKHTW
jgi:hypothetical protein